MENNIAQEIIDWYKEEADEEGEVYLYQAISEFAYSLYTREQLAAFPSRITVQLASGPAYMLENFGGEGQGDTRYVVFEVDGTIYRMDGYYASWDGDNWGGTEPYEVEPVEVSVTEYHRKK